MSIIAPISEASARPPKRLLDPIDRTSEILFGLIMVLTFTGSLSVAEAGREEVRTMLIGAIGCSLAWGLVDAIMYLMESLTERRGGFSTLRAVRETTDQTTAHGIIAEAMPPVIASIMRPDELESIRQQLVQLPEPARPRLCSKDFLAAVAIFLLVFLSAFPIVIPFIFMSNTMSALRVSNAIAIMLLLVSGWWLGRVSGIGAWRTGITMVVIGCVLVGITVALGG